MTASIDSTGVAAFGQVDLARMTAASGDTAIPAAAHELVVAHADLFENVILPVLRDEGVVLATWEDLDAGSRESLTQFFKAQVHPLLTPLAVDRAHPFPYISSLALNLAVVGCDRVKDTYHFASVEVPPRLPRLVSLGESRYVPLETVVIAHLPSLFPGLEVVGAYVFRITRHEEPAAGYVPAGDLLPAVERRLRGHRFRTPLRLEVEGRTSDRVLDLLVKELAISMDAVVRVPTIVDLTALFTRADLDRRDLPRTPAVGARARGLHGA